MQKKLLIPILSADQVRAADAFTIKNEPITSLDLMERASEAAAARLMSLDLDAEVNYHVFCGIGNNGGDGLAIARILHTNGFEVNVYLVNDGAQLAPDAAANMERLINESNVPLNFIHDVSSWPEMEASDIIIDALLGTGVNRNVSGLLLDAITKINGCENFTVSIDIPSGLLADATTLGAAVAADLTISFSYPKLAFLMPQNAGYVKDWLTVDIHLDLSFLDEKSVSKYYLNEFFVNSLLRLKEKYGHKGTFGHACIIAGSKGKLGAAVLAGKACMRTGNGLTTIHIPARGEMLLHHSLPEALIDLDRDEDRFTDIDEPNKYSVIGIGPGIGTEHESKLAIKRLLEEYQKPMVWDADAINILAQDTNLLLKLQKGSVLTPHVKEFERLVGSCNDDFERHEKQIAFAKKYLVTVVLKGAHTAIVTPDGTAYFNSTGNPGMAKGGSGDVLTGMITSLMAQGYTAEESAIMGVYYHGKAGDIARADYGEQAMLPTDLIDAIGLAFDE
jgi:NAD(P)H-hydrate epimerase